jgi:tripartite-type tricarboxylate transporter receptor subunit TctC
MIWRVMVALLLLASAAPARAQSWQPDRPVRLIVPFAPGIATDIVARVLAPGLGAQLGQPVVVDNRPAGGGVVGAEVVARAAPDGLTVGLLAAAPMAILPHLRPTLPYDPVRDFTPIAEVVDLPSVIAVHAAVPAHSLPELAAWLRAQDGRATCSGGTVGSLPHISMVLLLREWGVDCPLMFATAGAGVVPEIAAGRLAAGAPNIAAAIGPMRGGLLRFLAVTTATRLPAFPELPTVAETVPGFEAVSWNALYGPARLPEPIVARFAAAMQAALADPAIAPRLAELHAVPRSGDGAALAARQAREAALWGRVIREAGIRLE